MSGTRRSTRAKQKRATDPPRVPRSLPVAVRRVYSLTRREATAAIEIYRERFSEEQRIAEASLVGTIDETRNSTLNAFFLAERDDRVVGFAFMLFFPSFRMAHLMYLGVSSTCGHVGVGRKLFDVVVDSCAGQKHPPHWLTVEVLRPEAIADAEARTCRERGVEFLEKVGCVKVLADFQAPPIGPYQSVVPLWILARPVADADVDERLVGDMLRVIYRQVYGVGEDHPLVRHCMASIAEKGAGGRSARPA